MSYATGHNSFTTQHLLNIYIYCSFCRFCMCGKKYSGFQPSCHNMIQNHLLGANNCSASEENTHLLWNPNVNYSVHKNS
jgi:hypothetical protein